MPFGMTAGGFENIAGIRFVASLAESNADALAFFTSYKNFHVFAPLSLPLPPLAAFP